MLPSPSIRAYTLAAVAVVLAGCSTTNSCKTGNQDYLTARERPPLQMPEGVAGSERLGGSALVIPAISPTPDTLDPAPRCLDEPPGFFRRVGGAVVGSPEEAVSVWAMAWAGRRPTRSPRFIHRASRRPSPGVPSPTSSSASSR